MSSSPVAAGPLAAQVEPGELVKAMDTLVIDPPAFTAEKRVDPPVAVANARLGDLPDAGRDGVVDRRPWRVAEGRAESRTTALARRVDTRK